MIVNNTSKPAHKLIGKLCKVINRDKSWPSEKDYNVYQFKNPMLNVIGMIERDIDIFYLLDYEKLDSDKSEWKWCKILTTDGILGYILCYTEDDIEEWVFE